MFYVITEACIGVKDGECADVCPVRCIETTGDAPMYYIDPSQCIACRMCELVCPVSAIFADDSLPPEQERYVAINREFFHWRAG